MKPRQIILLRHGQTDYNATGRMQGHLDSVLSEVGRDQAHAVGEYFREYRPRISRIVSSDLLRAADTARIVAQHLDLDVHLDQRLRETNLGSWQGMARTEVDTDYPGQRAVWRHDATWAPPGGESRVDVAQRALPVVTEFMDSADGWDEGALLIVAHSGTIISLTSALLGLGHEQIPLLTGMGNTRFAQLSARPQFDREAHESALRAGTTVAAPTFDSTPAQWYLDGWNLGA